MGRDSAPTERSDAARNRTKILDAARRLLEERPIRDICMDDLAVRAGVGKGTLYRRFEDRASLCRALLHEESAQLQNFVLSGMDLPERTRWIERLTKLVGLLFDFAFDHRDLLSEALAFHRGTASRFDHPAHAWQRDSVSRHLERTVAEEKLPALDPTFTAELILAALDPDLLSWHAHHGKSRSEIESEFRRFWLRGVGVFRRR